MKYDPMSVIWNDWPALASATAIPITWGIFFGFAYLKPDASPLPLWLPAIVSVTLIVLLLWRIRRVNWFFSNGASTIGKITGLYIAKDRGRLEFIFDIGGKRVRSWMPIHKTKKVLSLSSGDRVNVLYDKNYPTRAIVQLLFMK